MSGPGKTNENQNDFDVKNDSEKNDFNFKNDSEKKDFDVKNDSEKNDFDTKNDSPKNDFYDKKINLNNPIFKDLASKFESTALPSEFSDVRDSFAVLCSVLSTGEGVEQEIGTKDAEEIKSAFNDYFTKVNRFIQENGDKVPLDFKIALRDSQIPLKTYRDGMEAGKTRREALADTSWISNLFNKGMAADPIDMPEHKGSEGNDFNISDNDEYKEIASRAKQAYHVYLSRVCGVDSNPFETLDYRFELIQKTLDTIPSPQGNGTVASDFAELAKQYLKYQNDYLEFNSEHVAESLPLGSYFKDTQVNRHQCIEMSTLVESFLEISRSVEGQENKKDAATLKRLGEVLVALKVKPKSFGLDEQRIEHIQKLTKAITIVKNLRYNFQLSRTRNGILLPVLGLDLDRAEYLANRLDEFEKNYFDYLSGRKTERVDPKPVIEEMIQAFGDDLKNPNSYSMSAHNDQSYYPPAIIESFNDIANKLPSYADKIASKITDAKKSLAEYFESQKNDFMYLEEGMYEELAKVQYAKHAGIVDNDLLFTFKCEYLFANESERQNTLDRLQSFLSGPKKLSDDVFNDYLKQFLIGQHFKNEFARMDKEYDSRGITMNPPGTEIYKLVLGSREDRSDKLMAHVERFFERPGIKAILEMEPKKISELLRSEDLDTKLAHAAYGDWNLIDDISDFSQEILEGQIKYYANGKIKATNSPLFKEVAKSLREITAKYHNMEDPAPEEYKQLYKACKKYVENRKPDASSDIGKQRFKAVAEVMAKVGLKLRDKLPDMRKSIGDDLTELALRSPESDELIKGLQTEKIVSQAKEAILSGNRSALIANVAVLMGMKHIIDPQELKPLAKDLVDSIPQGGLEDMAKNSKDFAKDFTEGITLFSNLNENKIARLRTEKTVDQRQPDKQHIETGRQ